VPHRAATVVSPADQDLLRAGGEGHRQNLGTTRGRAAGADADAVAARAKLDLGRKHAAGGLLVDGALQGRDPGTHDLATTVDDDLRGRDVAQSQRFAIGALALGELGSGEGVLPSQVVPVINGIGQGDNAGPGRDGLKPGIGLRTVGAALGGEQFNDDRLRRCRRPDGAGRRRLGHGPCRDKGGRQGRHRDDPAPRAHAEEINHARRSRAAHFRVKAEWIGDRQTRMSSRAPGRGERPS
jgi:hypothetical protein